VWDSKCSKTVCCVNCYLEEKPPEGLEQVIVYACYPGLRLTLNFFYGWGKVSSYFFKVELRARYGLGQCPRRSWLLCRPPAPCWFILCGGWMTLTFGCMKLRLDRRYNRGLQTPLLIDGPRCCNSAVFFVAGTSNVQPRSRWTLPLAKLAEIKRKAHEMSSPVKSPLGGLGDLECGWARWATCLAGLGLFERSQDDLGCGWWKSSYSQTCPTLPNEDQHQPM